MLQGGRSLHFSALSLHLQTFPKQTRASLCALQTFFFFCNPTALKQNHNKAKKKMPEPQRAVHSPALLQCHMPLMTCKCKQVGSVSALFTCSLLLHLKAVGAELFGCPPCPPHILCSARFLRREVCWESEAEIKKTDPNYFPPRSNQHSSPT